MIIVNLKKINTNFKKILEIYSQTTNFQNLECPNCYSHNIILWGLYERNVIYFNDESKKNINSSCLKIQRVRCKGCGKTHALLPNGIIPYKQISMELILFILLSLCDNPIEKVVNNSFLSFDTIRKILNDYKKYHLSKLHIITTTKNHFEALQKISKDILIQLTYIRQFSCCFMQIKLGCIGYIALLEGLTT